MLLFTDHLECLYGTGYDPGGWLPAPAAGWSGPEQALARCLTAGQPVCGFRPDGEGTSCLAVIEKAPRSQFDAVLEALQQGADLPDRSAAVGLRGTRFHGQRGRAWTALAGNLHLTAYARIDRPAAELGAALTALPAVAVAETVRALLPGRSDVGLKWVNDLLVGGAKTAGVLTATQTKQGRMEHAVFGVGLNVAASPPAGSGLVPRVTCLREAGAGVGHPLDVLRVLLPRLWQGLDQLLHQGPAGLLDRYRALSLVLGREVAVWEERADGREPDPDRDRPQARGRVVAIEDDLALRLAGRSEPVRRGRLLL